MKKEALEVLKNRRSIRKFQSRQISAEELDTVLEAGHLRAYRRRQAGPR